MRSRLLLVVLLALVTTAQAQWEIEESHTTASLRGIHNVGGGVAWASGTNGTVLRTEDGGYLWQTCTTPPGAEKLDFRGIQAFDENTAIVMSSGKGDLSRLYKTTDGCKSWKLLFTNPDKDGFWDAMKFPNSKQGYILGDPVDRPHPDDASDPEPFHVFALYRTVDGGRTFRFAGPFKNGAGPGQSAFAASNSSLFVDPPVVAFGTGGSSGARLYFDEIPDSITMNWASGDFYANSMWIPMQARSSAGIFSIAFRRYRGVRPATPYVAVVAVGGDYLRPDDPHDTAAYAGETLVPWHPAQTPPHGYRSAVAYDATTKTWITVGPNGTDISRDDGKNWTALKPGPLDQPDADKNWNALSLPFVVGPNGRIGKLRGDALKP